MSFSWSTVLNPCNLLRVFWEVTRNVWRRLEVCWARVVNPGHAAAAVDRAVAYQSRPTASEERMRRTFSLQAQDGSSSSVHDSPLSEQMPSFEAFSPPETISQTSRSSDPSGEQVASAERLPRDDDQSGQVQQEIPLLLRRQGSQRSHGQSSSSSGSAVQLTSESSDKSYKTF